MNNDGMVLAQLFTIRIDMQPIWLVFWSCWTWCFRRVVQHVIPWALRFDGCIFSWCTNTGFATPDCSEMLYDSIAAGMERMARKPIDSSFSEYCPRRVHALTFLTNAVLHHDIESPIRLAFATHLHYSHEPRLYTQRIVFSRTFSGL